MSDESRGAEQSTHFPMILGSNPAPGNGREKVGGKSFMTQTFMNLILRIASQFYWLFSITEYCMPKSIIYDVNILFNHLKSKMNILKGLLLTHPSIANMPTLFIFIILGSFRPRLATAVIYSCKDVVCCCQCQKLYFLG